MFQLRYPIAVRLLSQVKKKHRSAVVRVSGHAVAPGRNQEDVPERSAKTCAEWRPEGQKLYLSANPCCSKHVSQPTGPGPVVSHVPWFRSMAAKVIHKTTRTRKEVWIRTADDDPDGDDLCGHHHPSVKTTSYCYCHHHDHDHDHLYDSW